MPRGHHTPGFAVGAASPIEPDVQELLAAHLAFSRAHSPPEDSHALDLEGLTNEHVSFFTIRDKGHLIGVGALKHLDDHHVELKSIHTAELARGRGAGRAMVEHLVATARARGYLRASLETGTMEAFAASRALYRAAGFEPCEPFADYRVSPNSIHMTLGLD